MLFLYLILSTSLLYADHAGQSSGNGGDIVVCTKSSGKKTYELLDYHEGRNTYLKEIWLPDGETYMDIVFSTLLRVKNLFEKRYESSPPEPFLSRFFGTNIYERFYLLVSEFQNEVEWTDSNLQDIPDHGDVQLEERCSIKQVAIQYIDKEKDTRTYKINKPLWNKLNKKEKAGLVLHEIIYNHALMNNLKNSQKARNINYHLAINTPLKKLETITEYFFGEKRKNRCKLYYFALSEIKENFSDQGQSLCLDIFVRHSPNLKEIESSPNEMMNNIFDVFSGRINERLLRTLFVNRKKIWTAFYLKKDSVFIKKLKSFSLNSKNLRAKMITASFLAHMPKQERDDDLVEMVRREFQEISFYSMKLCYPRYDACTSTFTGHVMFDKGLSLVFPSLIIMMENADNDDLNTIKNYLTNENTKYGHLLRHLKKDILDYYKAFPEEVNYYISQILHFIKEIPNDDY